MFAGDYEVLDVLMLVGSAAPIALYFLVLGLVNSHARPHLISCRADFLALTSALVPVVLWPIPTFIQSGIGWLLVAGLFLLLALFIWMLVTAGTGYVIYNISEARCIRFLEDSLRGLGLTGTWNGRTWQDDSGRLTIHMREFTLLRNVTLHTEATDPKSASLVPTLGAELSRRFATVAQLPSTTGACLVLIGVALMIFPMWMFGRHIHDLVDAMSNFFG